MVGYVSHSFCPTHSHCSMENPSDFPRGPSDPWRSKSYQAAYVYIYIIYILYIYYIYILLYIIIYIYIYIHTHHQISHFFPVKTVKTVKTPVILKVQLPCFSQYCENISHSIPAISPICWWLKLKILYIYTIYTISLNIYIIINNNNNI